MMGYLARRRTARRRSRVLQVFAADPGRRWYLYGGLGKATGVRRLHLLYRTLATLEAEGMVVSDWDTPVVPGQVPGRRWYQLAERSTS